MWHVDGVSPAAFRGPRGALRSACSPRVQIPLARLEAEFAYYPFTGPEYPQGVPDPLAVQAHSDLNCSLACAGLSQAHDPSEFRRRGCRLIALRASALWLLRSVCRARLVEGDFRLQLLVPCGLPDVVRLDRSMHPHPARRLVTGGTSWQNVDPSVRPTRGAAAQMMGSRVGRCWQCVLPRRNRAVAVLTLRASVLSSGLQ